MCLLLSKMNKHHFQTPWSPSKVHLYCWSFCAVWSPALVNLVAVLNLLIFPMLTLPETFGAELFEESRAKFLSIYAGFWGQGLLFSFSSSFFGSCSHLQPTHSSWSAAHRLWNSDHKSNTASCFPIWPTSYVQKNPRKMAGEDVSCFLLLISWWQRWLQFPP